MNESIDPFIDRNVVILNEDSPAQMAARTMGERHIGSVLVSSNHRLVGIVTDRDIATLIVGYGEHPKTPLSEIMTTDIVTVSRTSSIPEVLKVMEINGVRRVPVVEVSARGTEQCLGLVTLDDLLSVRVIPPEQVSRIVKMQLMRQLHHRRMVFSDQRSETREQTLIHFYHILSESMEKPVSMVERMAYFLFKEILQKVPSTNAAHFISQLPSLLQEDMLNIPAGPNRSLKAREVVEDMSTGFRLEKKEVPSLIRKFWAGLKKATNEDIVQYIEVLLPRDFRQLLEIQEPVRKPKASRNLKTDSEERMQP